MNLLCVVALAVALAPVMAMPVQAEDPAVSGAGMALVATPEAGTALRRLMDGNARYVAGRAAHPDQSTERRVAISNEQHPFAIVLACADSRVPPELLFDQGLGDLFVVRNAGNLLDDHVLGSIEYAVEHLHVCLVMVLGHEKCGAVSAALAGGHPHGHIRSIVKSLAPVLAKSKRMAGDPVENAVRCNAQYSADKLVHSHPVLQEAHHAHKLDVVAARYDLATGRVELLK
jgi:carbonic anhydrase